MSVSRLFNAVPGLHPEPQPAVQCDDIDFSACVYRYRTRPQHQYSHQLSIECLGALRYQQHYVRRIPFRGYDIFVPHVVSAV